MLHRRGPSGPQPVISVTTNKTIRCVWIDVVRPATRESNTARVVSNVYRVPFPFSLSLSHLPFYLSTFFIFSLFLSHFILFRSIRLRPPGHPLSRTSLQLDLHGTILSAVLLLLVFAILVFPSVSSTCVSVSLSPSLVPAVPCSPSVFNIDYEMTIDLPDCV